MRCVLLLLLAACLIAAGAIFWLRVIDPVQRHMEFSRATRTEFESLAKKRPPSITKKQWHHVVAWTLNAHGNCITIASNMPQAERDKFLKELRSRLQGPVDVATIDWIWDELVRLTPSGRTYSENWRPTTPDRLQEFEEGNSIWAGIEVD